MIENFGNGSYSTPTLIGDANIGPGNILIKDIDSDDVDDLVIGAYREVFLFINSNINLCIDMDTAVINSFNLDSLCNSMGQIMLPSSSPLEVFIQDRELRGITSTPIMEQSG